MLFKGITVAVVAVIWVTETIAYEGRARQLKKSKSSNSNSNSSNSSNNVVTRDRHCVWTKAGLESIRFEDWKLFDDDSSSLYVKNFPFPGDDFTEEHLFAVQESSSCNSDDAQSVSSLDTLLQKGYVQEVDTAISTDERSCVTASSSIKAVPTLFSDPILVEESLIDYRLQFAADLGSKNIGESAAKGRLVNPAGRRLREHFYRFPDQCDATPIAFEVFLRLMM